MNDNNRKTVLFVTLGCKVNQYDSGALMGVLRDRGFAQTNSSPDAVIVNTCIVTSESERKSRQAIRRMRAKHPEALLCVVGCYSQRFPQKAAEVEGVDITAGISGYEALADEIESRLGGGGHGRRGNEIWSHEARTRAYIKIQDGCDNFCGYCIVPHTRGRSRSRALPDILAEAQTLMAQGVPEIVLIGIDISSYSYIETDCTIDCGLERKRCGTAGSEYIDFSGCGYIDPGGCGYIDPSRCGYIGSGGSERHAVGLAELAETVSLQLSRYGRRVRLRLSSLEPTVITPDFIKCIQAGRGIICPHFHLSLQSGCESVLRRMNRHYTPDEYYKAVCLLRGAFPGAGITTDIIAGYPGESEDEFRETYEFCKAIGFSKTHVFPYSKRPGTLAAELPGQVAPEVARGRVNALLALSDEMSYAFNSRYVGKTVSVLIENASRGGFEGLTDNYIRVKAAADGSGAAAVGCDGAVMTGVDCTAAAGGGAAVASGGRTAVAGIDCAAAGGGGEPLAARGMFVNVRVTRAASECLFGVIC